MSKINLKSSIIKAFTLLFVFVLVSNSIYFGSLKIQNDFWGLVIPYLSSLIFGLGFLYFFEHDTDFGFVPIIERKELKNQRVVIRHLRHLSHTSLIFVGALAFGPLVGAVMAHSLIRKLRLKYGLLALALAVSTFIWVGTVRGLFHLVFIR